MSVKWTGFIHIRVGKDFRCKYQQWGQSQTRKRPIFRGSEHGPTQTGNSTGPCFDPQNIGLFLVWDWPHRCYLHRKSFPNRIWINPVQLKPYCYRTWATGSVKKIISNTVLKFLLYTKNSWNLWMSKQFLHFARAFFFFFFNNECSQYYLQTNLCTL